MSIVKLHLVRVFREFLGQVLKNNYRVTLEKLKKNRCVTGRNNIFFKDHAELSHVEDGL